MEVRGELAPGVQPVHFPFVFLCWLVALRKTLSSSLWIAGLTFMVSLFPLLANKNEIYPWAVRLGLMWARVSGVLCPWTTLEMELHGSVYTYPLGLVISPCHGKWEGWKRAGERPPKMQDFRWMFGLDVIWDAQTPLLKYLGSCPSSALKYGFLLMRTWRLK